MDRNCLDPDDALKLLKWSAVLERSTWIATEVMTDLKLAYVKSVGPGTIDVDRN